VEALADAGIASLWDERELLIKQRDMLKQGEHAIFDGIRKPIAAIKLCLELRDHAMTVDEVFAMLEKGQWPMPNPVAVKGTVNDLLNYHAGLKTTQPKEITLRRIDERFGLLKWPDSKFKK
jgi:hypothetical protein